MASRALNLSKVQNLIIPWPLSFRSFLFLFCFFQVLNALGKLSAKDIWIQEPEAEVSLVAPSL